MGEKQCSHNTARPLHRTEEELDKGLEECRWGGPEISQGRHNWLKARKNIIRQGWWWQGNPSKNESIFPAALHFVSPLLKKITTTSPKKLRFYYRNRGRRSARNAASPHPGTPLGEQEGRGALEDCSLPSKTGECGWKSFTNHRRFGPGKIINVWFRKKLKHILEKKDSPN